MFCENCGNEIKNGYKFCNKCGVPSTQKEELETRDRTSVREENWWHRLAKVVYILMYTPLLLLIPVVWDESSSTCSGSYYYNSYSCRDTYGEAIWYSFLTLLVYLVIVRLMKLTYLYVVSGEKPAWKKEFKKLF